MGDVRRENNLAVTFADKVARGMKRPLKIIEAHLIKLLLVVHAHHVVTKGHERHMDGADSLQQIWINCPGENDTVNQSVLLKDGRKVDALGRGLGRVVQRREQHVLLHPAGVRFDALQDARMKRMKKIAVTEKKADHFRAPLENAASLRVGAKSQAVDGIQYARARLSADLRTRIQHAGDRSDTDTCGPGYLANRRFCWNRFHCRSCFQWPRAFWFQFGGAKRSIFPAASLPYHEQNSGEQLARRPYRRFRQQVKKRLCTISFFKEVA